MKKTILPKGLTFTFMFFLLTSVFFSGCTQRPLEAKLPSINIAFQEWVGYGPLYLAKEKGFMREEGIDLVFIDEQLDLARAKAFKQGMLDSEAGTLDLLISKASKDAPIAAVLEIDQSFGSDGIAATENIKKIEDLVNKKIALARDDVGETFISYLFSNKGLAFNDLNVVSKRPEDVVEAFIKGEADACVTWEPQLTRALQRPGAHILASSREYSGIIIDTLNVRKDLIKNNPKLVRQFMRGWFRALNYYREHPIEASGIIAKYYRLTAEQYRKQAEGLKWVSYAEQLNPSKYKEWLKTVERIIDLKLTNGKIPKKIEASKIIDHTLLESLYEDIQ